MADKSSTGAVHLTTIDLDISDALQTLQDLNEAIVQNAELARQPYENLFKNLNVDTSSISNATTSFNEIYKQAGTSKSAIESLNLSYKTFLATLSKSKLSKDGPLKEIKEDAKANAKEIKKLNAIIKSGAPITKETVDQYYRLSSALKESKGALKDAERMAYETGEGFQSLGKNAQCAGGMVTDFFNSFADKLKLLSAYQVIQLIKQAFVEVVHTIKDTEDAIVELKRVLSEDISSSAISSELYDIADQFGQSFENVQQTALRFAQTGQSWNAVLDSTRATMLGLNTAELEITTATEGLIAVMAQFNIEASDLELVIDKINITADSFPVTSEKIVAALQRAGGTASAFNMTLEETIAVITALAEKSGRSGENIGTALNSLIIFTSKAENLKLFSGLSEQMDNVVKKFQSGSGSIIDVWNQLNKEISKLSKQQEDALFESTAFEEFADQFEAEAAEYAGTIQQIYGTAGAYRRNYLTILLQDMQTVEDVMKNMSDAEGYSLAENAQYMDTLTSKWNQLVVAAKKLAVQIGKGGLLDLLKWLTEATTGVLKLTKSLGGLSTVLSALSTTFLFLKKERINKIFNDLDIALKNISKNTKTSTTVFTAYTTAIANGATRVQAFTIALNTLKLTMGDLIAIIGLGITAIQMITGAYDEWQQTMQDARTEAIDLGKDAEESFSNMNELLKQLEDAKVGGNPKDIEVAHHALIEYFGYQKDDIPLLIREYGNLDQAINVLANDQRELLKLYAEERRIAAEGDLRNINPIGPIKLSITSEELNKLSKQAHSLKKVGAEINDSMLEFGEISLDVLTKIPKTAREAKKQISDINKYITYLKENYTSKELAETPLLSSLIKMREEIKKWTGAIDDAEDFLESFEEKSFTVFDAITETFNKFYSSLDFEHPVSFANLETDIEALGEAFDILSGKVDSFQGAYSSILKIVEEYNETGRITADQMQTLLGLEPEYISLLEEKEGKLSINKQRLDELIQANDDYMLQMTAIKMAEQAEALAKEILSDETRELTVEEIKAKIATQALTTDISKAAYEMLTGADDGTKFRDSLLDIANQAGATKNQIAVYTGEINNLIGSYTNMVKASKLVSSLMTPIKDAWDQLNNKKTGSNAWFYNPASTTSKGTSKSSSKSPAETAIENQKKAYDELLKRYEDEIYFMQTKNATADDLVAKYKEMQEAVHQQKLKYIELGGKEDDEYARSLGKKWWELQKEIEKIISGIYEDSVDAYRNAIEELEYEYSKLEGMMDYSGMSDNLEKQLEYQKKIMEDASAEYERLIKKGIDINDDAVQSVIKDWRNASNAIEDIGEKMAENIIEPFEDFISLADSFDVWDSFDFTKSDYIKNELEEINKLFNEGSLSISKYKDYLERLGKAYLDARVDALEDSKEDIENRYNAIIDGYKEQIEQIKNQKEESDKYYDKLIDNLHDVEESNERINAQLDYYAERQKILRNIEQAQARSGVEWREKEIQYQEELADLDENWRRQQEDWSISDQIEILEKLKEDAANAFEESIKRLEEYIENAEKESEVAIENVSKEIEALKEKIYRAITEELERAKLSADSLKNALWNIGDNIKPQIDSIGNQFENTMEKSIKSVADMLKKELETAGDSVSKSIYNSMKTNVIDNLNKEVQNVMKAQTSNNAVRKAVISSTKPSTSSNKAPIVNSPRNPPTLNVPKKQETNNIVNIYANMGNNVASGAINSVVNRISDFFTNPSRF